MTRAEKLLGVVLALLWGLLLVFLVGCNAQPTGIEWDGCHESVNPETGRQDVTYCWKDTVIVHE